MAAIKNDAIYDFDDIPIEDREEFEYVAAYLVDTYYNKLFTKAEEYYASKHKKTLTECYRLALTNYNVMFREARNASAIFNQFHEYYTSTSGKPLHYEECIFKIVKAIVPVEFSEKMKRQDYVMVLTEVWVGAIQHMTNIIYRSYIPLIIDKRDDVDASRATTLQLQDEMINILAMIRESYYNDFYKQTTVSKSNQAITSNMSKRMKHTIEKLVHEKTELKVKLQTVEQLVYKMHHDNSQKNETIESLTRELEEHKVRAKTMEIAIRGYRRAIGEDENAPLPGISLKRPPTESKQSAKLDVPIKQDQQNKQDQKPYRDYFDVDHFERDINEQIKDTGAQVVDGGDNVEEDDGDDLEEQIRQMEKLRLSKKQQKQTRQPQQNTQMRPDMQNTQMRQSQQNQQTRQDQQIAQSQQTRQTRQNKQDQSSEIDDEEPRPRKTLDTKSPLVTSLPIDMESIKSETADIDFYG